MRVLIIGGTRFLGPYVIGHLLGQGHDVTIFNRGETIAEMPQPVKRIRGDRKDVLSFVSEFERIAPDVVIDLIAYTESDAANVIKAFGSVARRLVVLGSMDVYLAYDIFRGVMEARFARRRLMR